MLYFDLGRRFDAVVCLFSSIGYMRTAALGVLVMAIGCLLFIPASSSAMFAVFLFALFVLAAGITTVQPLPSRRQAGPAVRRRRGAA